VGIHLVIDGSVLIMQKSLVYITHCKTYIIINIAYLRQMGQA